MPLGLRQRVVSGRPTEMYQDNQSVDCLWREGDFLTSDKDMVDTRREHSLYILFLGLVG